jgi:hypothetical protein
MVCGAIRARPAFHPRGLVGGGVVQHHVHVQLVGDLGVDLGQELLELDRRCRARSELITAPVSTSSAA